MSILLCGESIELHPEHAIFWADQSVLFVADTHWGKAATFRDSAIPLPDTEIETDLSRLSGVLRRTKAEKLVVLGDLLHDRRGRDPKTFAAIERWRESHADLQITVTEGNHDRSAGQIPQDWRVHRVSDELLLRPFVCKHFPEPSAAGYVLSGHLHPKARLVGPAGQAVSLPCFWFGDKVGVLPAFGTLCGGSRVSPAKTDRVYVIADDAVIDVGC